MSKYKREATYNKLVRDRIPEIIREDGLEPIMRKLSDAKAILELKKKVLEEASEFIEAETVDDLVVELADLREVEMSLMKKLKISEALVNKVRIRRREDRGGFDGNNFLIETKEKI